MTAVEIVDHDPRWEARAGELRRTLAAALGPLAQRVDHIGSTSIPGMAAKDIIDLQVGVDDLEGVTAPFGIALAPLGFERLPYDRDHVPAGRDDLPAVWAKRFWLRRSARDGDVNLHVRVVGAPNFRLALLFRDWLRAHPDAVPAYSTFKRALAAATPDADTYTDVKDPVVDLVVSVAERWARESGWAP